MWVVGKRIKWSHSSWRLAEEHAKWQCSVGYRPVRHPKLRSTCSTFSQWPKMQRTQHCPQPLLHSQIEHLTAVVNVSHTPKNLLHCCRCTAIQLCWLSLLFITVIFWKQYIRSSSCLLPIFSDTSGLFDSAWSTAEKPSSDRGCSSPFLLVSHQWQENCKAIPLKHFFPACLLEIHWFPQGWLTGFAACG